MAKTREDFLAQMENDSLHNVVRSLIDDLYGEEEDANNDDGGYDSWSVQELRDELRNRDLPTSGNKPDLIENLEASDKANGDG